MSKTLLCIGDLHVGSRDAISPPEVEVSGTRIKSSKQQDKLYREFELMVDQIGKVDALLVNGDTCEGNNHKRTGEGCWSTEKKPQVEAALELLKMIPVKGKTYVTEGSHYHTGSNPSTEEMIADRLPNSVCEYEHFIDFGGKLIYANHKTPYGKGEDRKGNAASRQIALHKMNDTHADITIKSHTHYFVYTEQTGGIYINTPAWKFRDTFMKQGGEVSTIPDRGWVLLEISSGGDLMVTKSVKRADFHEIFEVSEV